ncbi:MAG TPA: S8 family serine peptidase, partial [Thermoanaerobaculia bacterium]|nr:S8 family serine peptidase [Thermoanaerobaculia bacterium]
LPLAAVPPTPTGGADEAPLELLLTPHRDAGAARLAAELRWRLDRSRRAERGRLPARIAYTHSYVVARLYFDEVVRVLLPLTEWWRDFVWTGMFTDADADEVEDRTLRDLLAQLDPDALAAALAEWSSAQVPEDAPRGTRTKRDASEGLATELSHDLLWMLRVVGTLHWARRLDEGPAAAGDVPLEDGRVAGFPRGADGEVDYRLLIDAALALLDSALSVIEAPQPSLFLVNRNRDVALAVADSRRAIKADAAANLFEIRCEDLIWAILDSGVDATHPAFRMREDEDAAAAAPPAHWSKRSRVVKTYDFTRLRPLLDPEVVRELLNADDVAAQRFGDDDLDARLQPIRRLLAREAAADAARKEAGAERGDPALGRLRDHLEELRKRLQKGREIDWELLDPLLRVPHDDSYPPPTSNHGTHVAGILAADWQEKGLHGVCPDIRLYDLRVLDPRGPNDEFTVLAALQFIQYLNRQQELLTVQGANLSLSIRHEVTNYACGRTPVCDECERLVSSGVVVVAAAGNAGWDEELARAAAGAGYRTVSITDPGNAEAVITVGATHRDRPHTYGVSFFSSRGPTGDGRAKPDLVAPGEKITSTVPGGGTKREDGTSMAAPHVSGAAALLMARHPELVGRPTRIKEILCRTATDLGRERHFQGAGMLDVLRALQSI